MHSTVFNSFLYRLFTAHAKRSCPHRSDRKERRENEFLFLFFSYRILRIIQIRGIYIFFLHISTCLHFYFHFFFTVRLEKYWQIKIQSILSGLCLASPTINVKFRDAKTGTGAALTGSGFR